MASPDAFSESSESPLLTVPEASRVLRIGRQLGYQLAHEYLASGGTSGLPVVRFGRKNLRVPRWALNELAETRHPSRCEPCRLTTPSTPS
jgi:hypothetical protein